MKYAGVLCELSKLNAYPPRNTDAPILVYKHRPERTGFNMCAENTQQPLTFLAVLCWILRTSRRKAPLFCYIFIEIQTLPIIVICYD